MREFNVYLQLSNLGVKYRCCWGLRAQFPCRTRQIYAFLKTSNLEANSFRGLSFTYLLETCAYRRAAAGTRRIVHIVQSPAAPPKGGGRV
jgi:hypothetical protein